MCNSFRMVYKYNDIYLVQYIHVCFMVPDPLLCFKVKFLKFNPLYVL